MGGSSTKLAPWKSKALPTFPSEKRTCPGNSVVIVPGLPPATSLALPSAGHQLTKPEGGGMHGGSGGHFPEEPALKTAATSDAETPRLDRLSASIRPRKAANGGSFEAPMITFC